MGAKDRIRGFTGYHSIYYSLSLSNNPSPQHHAHNDASLAQSTTSNIMVPSTTSHHSDNLNRRPSTTSRHSNNLNRRSSKQGCQKRYSADTERNLDSNRDLPPCYIISNSRDPDRLLRATVPHQTRARRHWFCRRRFCRRPRLQCGHCPRATPNTTATHWNRGEKKLGHLHRSSDSPAATTRRRLPPRREAAREHGRQTSEGLCQQALRTSRGQKGTRSTQDRTLQGVELGVLCDVPLSEKKQGCG